MKLYINPKAIDYYVKMELEDMVIYVSAASELRFWWEIQKWTRKPYLYLSIEIHTKPFVRQLSEGEAVDIYTKHIKSTITEASFSRIRIFTNPVDITLKKAHVIFDRTQN